MIETTIVTAEEELERIFNLSLDMICTASFDGYFKKVNPSFSRILGFSEEELLAKPFIDFVHPDDVESTLTELAKLSEGAITLKFTNRYHCKDGSYRWFEWNVNPDVESKTLYAVAHDITDQRNIQFQLKDTERQLRMSYDNSSIGMTWAKSDKGFFRVNKAFCDLVGYAEEELLTMTPQDVVHPDDRGIQEEFFKSLVDDQIESPKLELRILRKDELIVYARIHAVFIKNNVKGIGYFFTQVEDITKQKETEQALRESELSFRSIFEDSPIAIDFFDSKGNFLYANQAALDMFGVSSDDGMKRLNILNDPNTPLDVVDKVTRGENARFESQFDFEKVKEQGIYETTRSGILHLDAVLSPLRISTDNSVKGYLVQLLDISERKIAQAMQQRLTEELEDIVEERTRELREAQKELSRKQRLATLGQISGGISHELRNPLGAIKNAGYLVNLLVKNPSDDLKQSLDIINTEVANCERIISSLLDFARPKPPRLQKVIINGNLNTSLSSVTFSEGIELVEDFAEDLPIILADPTQLQIAFTNLASNAIQAMPEGGKITVRSAVGSDKSIVISVTDTGIGISEENVQKIFEPLFTTKAKGIGLGLAIVKSIVELHNGTISVSSELGIGTTFEISLPVSPGGVK